MVYENEVGLALRLRSMLVCKWQMGRIVEPLADRPNWEDNYHRGGKTFNPLKKENTFMRAICGEDTPLWGNMSIEAIIIPI